MYRHLPFEEIYHTLQKLEQAKTFSSLAPDLQSIFFVCLYNWKTWLEEETQHITNAVICVKKATGREKVKLIINSEDNVFLCE